MERTIGIDAGGTLTKIAYFNKKLLTFEKFYSHEQHKIIDWIKNNNGIKQICITGVNRNYYSNCLQVHIK